jgi:hypothetical protein
VRVVVEGQGTPVAPADRDRAARLVRLAVGRLGGRLADVTVRLWRVETEKGACHWCRVTARLDGQAPLTGEDADPDQMTAVGRAVRRVGQAIERRLVWAELFPELATPRRKA